MSSGGAATTSFVYIKSFADDDFAFMPVAGGEVVGSVIYRACSMFSHWGVNPLQVRLYLVLESGDKPPDSGTIAAALNKKHLLVSGVVPSRAWLVAQSTEPRDGSAAELTTRDAMWEKRLAVLEGGALSRMDLPSAILFYSELGVKALAKLRDKGGISNPLQLIQCMWDQPGSLAALRSFFEARAEPPLVSLLRCLLTRYSAVPCSPPGGTVGSGGGGWGCSGGGGPFLGAGASARVFAVAREGYGEPLALKACLNVDRDALEFEFSAMTAAGQAGAPVVAAVPGSLEFCYGEGREEGVYLGGGYLLHHVCRPAAITSLASCQAAFHALLMLHQAGWAHGDARVPNLVLVDEGVCRGGAGPEVARSSGSRGGSSMQWIDMRECPSGNVALARQLDAQTLAASIGGFDVRAPPFPIQAALQGIGIGGAGAAEYRALAEAVWGTN